MDYPNARPADKGKPDLGGGPGLWHGPKSSPNRRADAANKPRWRRLRLLSVPLRHMHTPSEVLCLDDLQHTIDLVSTYFLRLEPDIDFTSW
jgi:hypothetical protein